MHSILVGYHFVQKVQREGKDGLQSDTGDACCHDTYLGLLKVMNLVELSFEQIGEFLLICQANTYSVEPLRPF
jgi:hypothetical protein